MSRPATSSTRFPAAPEVSASGDAAREFIAPAAPWIERLARVGFAAKALLYTIVGGLALQAAVGDGGKTTGSRGALTTLVRQDFGPLLLLAMAVGLFGYAAWRIAEAILDPERRGSTMKAIALRLSFAARGLLHAALGLEAARLAMGANRAGGDGTEQWTARALDAPFGSWIVVGMGIAVAGYGAYQLYRAWVAKLSRQLDLSRVSSGAASWVVRICRFGIGARGLVFVVIGLFLARAGTAHNANKAADTGEALNVIGQQPFGAWLLAFVAVGLVAYGAYEIVQARYRVIRPA